MVDLVTDKASDDREASSESALMKAVQAMHKLTLEEKVRLLEYLSRSMQLDMKQEEYREMSWEEFLDMTHGSLADDPIELPDRFEAQGQNVSQ